MHSKLTGKYLPQWQALLCSCIRVLRYFRQHLKNSSGITFLKGMSFSVDGAA